ncbi:MAG: phosphatase PAP2 family protein [Clostridia bacterium]|nr:phosphatase PAP2 family protein [Clostridia bacterium]
MEFLRFLEGIRNPVLDFIFSTVTHLGEETILIAIGLFIFWCVGKKHGYYILSVGFIGLILNSILKLLFRIPRPWVADEDFTIVESARGEATGYSFPSGHTQTSVGLFGSIARSIKLNWVRISCIAICILVPFSRMYLGVHTPADVIVSSLIGIALIFTVYPLLNKAYESFKGMNIFFAALALFGIVGILFIELFPFPADLNMSNYESSAKGIYKLFGCILAIWLCYVIDSKYIKFETKAVWWAQIIKFSLGLAIVLGIKAGVKAIFGFVGFEGFFADAVRYFLVVLAGAGAWPMTFRFFSSLGKRSSMEGSDR